MLADVASHHVTFVAVDFTIDDWMDRLIKSGFDPASPTLFLLEGVTYYLSDEDIDACMRRIAACQCARVAFDVYYSWFSLHPLTVSFMETKFGEPFKSGVEDGHAAGPAVRAGMEVIQVVDSDEANATYVPCNAANELM